MDSTVGWSLDGLSFSLCSTFVPAFFFLDSDNSELKIFKWVGVPIPPLGGHVYLLEVVSSGSFSLLLGISANVLSIGS
jgi:hypothetical protein